MIYQDKYYMGKDEAAEKVLTVDEGVSTIATECWVYEDWVDVKNPNGDFVFSQQENIYGAFEELIVPESVTRIEERAFYRHKALKRISVLSAVTEIGKEAFKGCDNLPFVVAPKVSFLSIADPESKMKLAMGYLLHPDLYAPDRAEEYRQYIGKQKKKLLQTAQRFGLTEAEALLDPTSAGGADTKSGGKKRSPEDDVIHLEKLVLSGSKEELADAIKKERPYEMTARALGLACRCREPEIVELLLKEKMSFTIKDPKIISKYGLSYRPSGREFTADFPLLMVVDNVWNKYLFGSMDKYYLRENPKMVFSDYLKAEKDVSAVPKSMKMAPISVRAENLKLLVRKKALTKQQMNRLLYFAVLEEETGIADTLSDLGAVIDVPWLLSDGEHKNCTSELNQYLDAMNDKTPERRLAVLRDFSARLNRGGKKMYLTDSIFNALDGRISVDAAQVLIESGDTTGLNKKQLLQDMVKRGQTDVLSLLLDVGFISTPKQRDELIALAADKKQTEVLALLMDYKNKTADLAREEKKAEADLKRELNAAPDSVSELKKIWSYKKKEDGTILITSYKGEDTEIIVPERIGKAAVTELDKHVFSSDLFSAGAKRITNLAVRKAITKIVLPEGLLTIGAAAFWGCARLETVEIPDSVTTMGSHMFTRCTGLKAVRLPKHLSSAISDHFFSDCGKLQELRIPNGVLELGLCAFSDCDGLRDLYLGKDTKPSQWCWLDRLPNLTIHAPAGSYAEQYAKEHNIRFEAE